MLRAATRLVMTSVHASWPKVQREPSRQASRCSVDTGALVTAAAGAVGLYLLSRWDSDAETHYFSSSEAACAAKANAAAALAAGFRGRVVPPVEDCQGLYGRICFIYEPGTIIPFLGTQASGVVYI